MITRILRVFAVLAGLVFAAAGEPAAVDKPKEKKRKSSIGGYYTLLEAPALDKEIVHASLESQGFVISQDLEQGGGGGMLLQRGRLVVDTGGAGTSGEDVNGRSYEFGGGQLGLGLIFIQTGFMRVYPLVGVGGVSFSGELPQASGDEAEVADSAQAGAGAGLVTAGLCVDFRLKFWRFSVMVGLRMGFGAVLGAAIPGTGVSSRSFFRVVVGPALGF
jgi:hypothetical protein